MDRISERSDMYRVRSRGGYGQWGQMWMDTAAGSKNVAGSRFLSCVVNWTMERGRGRVFVPEVDIVSALDIADVGREVLNVCTYQE